MVFHVVDAAAVRIGMFPIIMVVAALVFFWPSWPSELVTRLGSAQVEATPSPAAASPAPPSRWRSRFYRAALVLGGLYCALQVLVPLRCHLYGGNVLWHEQGMRFSWR